MLIRSPLHLCSCHWDGVSISFVPIPPLLLLLLSDAAVVLCRLPSDFPTMSQKQLNVNMCRRHKLQAHEILGCTCIQPFTADAPRQ